MAPFSASSCLRKARRTSDPTVLLLDEDDDFRNGLAEHLRDDGYVVRECAVPNDLPPLDALRDIRLVITDYQLAGARISIAPALEFHGFICRVEFEKETPLLWQYGGMWWQASEANTNQYNKNQRNMSDVVSSFNCFLCCFACAPSCSGAGA